MMNQILILLQQELRFMQMAAIGFIGIYTVLCTMLKRKHAIWLMVLTTTAKSLYTQFLVPILLQVFHIEMPYLSMVSMILAPILIIIVSIYTFDETLVKILPALMISEMVGGWIMLLSSSIVGWIRGENNVAFVFGTYHITDLLGIPIGLALLALFYKLLKPILLRYRNWEIKRGALVYVLFAGYLGLSSTTYFMDYWNGTGSSIGSYLTLAILLMAGIMAVYLCVRLTKMKKAARQRNLRVQQRMMTQRYALIRENKMGYDYERIGAQIDEWKMLHQGKITEERVQNYLSDLKQEYDSLRYGIYCSDLLVDTVIACQAEILKKKNIRFDCSSQGYQRGFLEESDVADIVYQLLQMGDALLSEGSYGKKSVEDKGEEKTKELSLTLKTVANQLLIQMECKNSDGRMRKLQKPKWFREYKKKYAGNGAREGDRFRQRMILSLET